MQTEELIQRVQSLYSKGVHSDDTRLSARHIYSALISARSLLLKQKADKNQIVNQWAYQEISCAELIEASLYDCPCVPSTGCKFLRTVKPLPTPISGMDEHFIQSVSSLDGQIIFSETTFNTLKYEKGSKYTSNLGSYFIKNGYLFIYTNKGIKAVTIVGLFDDPYEVYSFPSVCTEQSENNLCTTPMEMPFPIDRSLATALVEIAAKELLDIMKRSIEDKHNDSSENLNQAPSNE